MPDLDELISQRIASSGSSEFDEAGGNPEPQAQEPQTLDDLVSARISLPRSYNDIGASVGAPVADNQQGDYGRQQRNDKVAAAQVPQNFGEQMRDFDSSQPPGVVQYNGKLRNQTLAPVTADPASMQRDLDAKNDAGSFIPRMEKGLTQTMPNLGGVNSYDEALPQLQASIPGFQDNEQSRALFDAIKGQRSSQIAAGVAPAGGIARTPEDQRMLSGDTRSALADEADKPKSKGEELLRKYLFDKGDGGTASTLARGGAHGLLSAVSGAMKVLGTVLPDKAESALQDVGGDLEGAYQHGQSRSGGGAKWVADRLSGAVNMLTSEGLGGKMAIPAVAAQNAAYEAKQAKLDPLAAAAYVVGNTALATFASKAAGEAIQGSDGVKLLTEEGLKRALAAYGHTVKDLSVVAVGDEALKRLVGTSTGPITFEDAVKRFGSILGDAAALRLASHASDAGEAAAQKLGEYQQGKASDALGAKNKAQRVMLGMLRDRLERAGVSPDASPDQSITPPNLEPVGRVGPDTPETHAQVMAAQAKINARAEAQAIADPKAQAIREQRAREGQMKLAPEVDTAPTQLSGAQDEVARNLPNMPAEVAPHAPSDSAVFTESGDYSKHFENLAKAAAEHGVSLEEMKQAPHKIKVEFDNGEIAELDEDEYQRRKALEKRGDESVSYDNEGNAIYARREARSLGETTYGNAHPVDQHPEVRNNDAAAPAAPAEGNAQGAQAPAARPKLGEGLSRPGQEPLGEVADVPAGSTEAATRSVKPQSGIVDWVKHNLEQAKVLANEPHLSAKRAAEMGFPNANRKAREAIHEQIKTLAVEPQAAAPEQVAAAEAPARAAKPAETLVPEKPASRPKLGEKAPQAGPEGQPAALLREEQKTPNQKARREAQRLGERGATEIPFGGREMPVGDLPDSKTLHLNEGVKELPFEPLSTQAARQLGEQGAERVESERAAELARLKEMPYDDLSDAAKAFGLGKKKILGKGLRTRLKEALNQQYDVIKEQARDVEALSPEEAAAEVPVRRIGAKVQPEKAPEKSKAPPKLGALLPGILPESVSKSASAGINKIADAWSGKDVPRTEAADKTAAGLLAKLAGAHGSVTHVARSLLAEMGVKTDKEMHTLGAVIGEINQRQMPEPEKGKTVFSFVGPEKNQFFKTEGDFQEALKSPKIQNDLAELDKFNVQREKLFAAATGLPESELNPQRKSHMSLLPNGEEGPEGDSRQKAIGTSVQANTKLARAASGTAELGYSTDLQKTLEHNLRNLLVPAATQELASHYLKAGLANETGDAIIEKVPNAPDIKHAVTPVQLSQAETGITKTKMIFVRNDLVPELRKALGLEKGIIQPLPGSGLINHLYTAGISLPLKRGFAERHPVLGAANLALSAVSPEAVAHTLGYVRRLSALPGRTQSALLDASRISGLNQADILGATAQITYGVLRKDPGLLREISDIAKIGAARPSRTEEGQASLTEHTDAAARILAGRMWENLSARGVPGFEKGNVNSKREFINSLGNYNETMQGDIVRSFKALGLSPFAVATTSNTRAGAQRWVGSIPGNESKALRASEVARNVLGKGIMGMTMAYLIWRKTPEKDRPEDYMVQGALGQPQLPSVDEQGKRLQVDLYSLDGMSRGDLGQRAVAEGLASGQKGNDILDKAAGSALNRAKGMLQGPLEDVYKAYAEAPVGKKDPEESETGFRVKNMAKKGLNPMVKAMFEAHEKAAEEGSKTGETLQDTAKAAGEALKGTLSTKGFFGKAAGLKAQSQEYLPKSHR